MRRQPKTGSPRQLDALLLASGSRFQRYRWLVLVAAVVLEIAIIWVAHQTGALLHPLDPAGAGVVFISVLAAGLGGVLVGLIAALAGGVAGFIVLAGFGTSQAIVNGIVSVIIWCGAAATAGLVAGYLRRQVAKRETALQHALDRSLHAREQMERVLDFSPRFYQSEDQQEAASAICKAAVETFGTDGARLYVFKDDSIEMLGLAPLSRAPSHDITPGAVFPLAELPEIRDTLARRRPLYIRDARLTRLNEPALKLRAELGVVSAIVVSVAGPAGPVGLLSLGWTHVIERPTEDFTAIIQRFADQAAIAWQNALRAEAQRQAQEMHETLQKVCALAPTFHISGTQQQVAQAICEAALSTFDCTGAALCHVEGERLRLLHRRPPVGSLRTGLTFPLTRDLLLTHGIVAPQPIFVSDLLDSTCFAPSWPRELVHESGTRSCLCVPMRFGERGPQNLLLLSWNQVREEPDPALLVIAERFADQAAMALSNAAVERLHARLEASLLPVTPVDHPRLHVTTRYRTGEQRLRLGGDFVGAASAGDTGLHFVIGDVSGHGPDAAALGATLRATWKALALAGVSLPEMMKVMGNMLLAEKREPVVFASIISGFVDLEQQAVSFVNAGHLPPLLLAGGLVSPLESRPASPLGVDGAPWSLTRFRLPRRWRLFLYTDGLIEARVAPGATERYGEARLMKRLSSWTDSTPNGQALDVLMREIESASGSHFADDVALLLISTKGRSATQEA